MTNYQQAKEALKRTAKSFLCRVHFKNDKPGQRQLINEMADALCKDYRLTDYQQNLLHNFAEKLHPLEEPKPNPTFESLFGTLGEMLNPLTVKP